MRLNWPQGEGWRTWRGCGATSPRAREPRSERGGGPETRRRCLPGAPTPLFQLSWNPALRVSRAESLACGAAPSERPNLSEPWLGHLQGSSAGCGFERAATEGTEPRRRHLLGLAVTAEVPGIVGPGR